MIPSTTPIFKYSRLKKPLVTIGYADAAQSGSRTLVDPEQIAVETHLVRQADLPPALQTELTVSRPVSAELTKRN